MSTDKSVAIGVELSGGGGSIALVDGRGRVLQRCRARTLRGRPAIATLEPYVQAIDTLLADAQAASLCVQGLGVSIPGTLDALNRRPLQIPTLSALNDFPLYEFLEARYRLPITLQVDVDAALLGEHRFGAGRGFRRLLFVTLNAVVGAALVVDGRVERAAPQYVGHISHMLVASHGPVCSCGKRGCINSLVSMEAMQKMVQRALRRGEETSLRERLLKREYFSSTLLAEEAGRGDSVALQVYGEVGRWLGTATARYISLFDPNILIIGGGVLSASEILFAQVQASLLAQTALEVRERVKVVPSYLGNDAAVLGAVVPLFS